MKTDNLMDIPPVPVIVQSIMPSPRCHLSHAWSKWICMRPANFDLLTTSPSCTLRITEAKALPTLHSMPGDVPAGNSNINLHAWLDFHVFVEFRHAFAKILRTLTNNVVCDKNPRQHNADKGGEDNVVHVTVSEMKKSILTMV